MACYSTIAMARVNGGRLGMIVSGDVPLRDFILSGDKPYFHSAGAVTIIETHDMIKSGFADFYYSRLSSYSQLLSSSSYCRGSEKEFIFCLDSSHESSCLNALLEFVNKTPALNSVMLSSFDYIIPPQISSEFISDFTNLFGLKTSQVIDNTSKYGDLSNASIPSALHSIGFGACNLTGKSALFLSIGSGGQVAALTYRF
jgi:3-oxoacyl-[acyl-carrier-protein] synthase III